MWESGCNLPVVDAEMYFMHSGINDERPYVRKNGSFKIIAQAGKLLIVKQIGFGNIVSCRFRYDESSYASSFLTNPGFRIFERDKSI